MTTLMTLPLVGGPQDGREVRMPRTDLLPGIIHVAPNSIWNPDTGWTRKERSADFPHRYLLTSDGRYLSEDYKEVQ